MTVVITLDQVQAIYAQGVHAGPLRDRSALENAAVAPFTSFFGQEQYPTLIEKAARLAFGIAQAQAYHDGNKRLAWLVSVVLLEINGTVLNVEQVEAARAIRALGEKNSDGRPALDYDGLVSWYTECVAYPDDDAMRVL